ncbi:MAG: radical SAM protein [Spirochaetes bacterium]|nr:radical SAM protein [Spirochaetota bacterium]
MRIHEIQARSILRKHKKIDSWFLSRYGMNLYRSCPHNCIYCDGRYEKYQTEGEFGKDVFIKINAIDILKHELDPSRKRKPLRSGYIMLGGGIGDSYNPAEEKYGLTRRALELIHDRDFPVHILTKSTLVKRDIDILKQINKKKKVILSFSFSSVNSKISRIFEPGVPDPEKRLEAISFFKARGFSCGMFLMPVIPFITDTPALLEESIKKAKEAGVDFIIFGGMTLKPGRQKEFFYETLKEHYPGLIPHYDRIYNDHTPWGEANKKYYESIHDTFKDIVQKWQVPVRIPPVLFQNVLDENDRVIVLLEHIDYLLKLLGKPSLFGYAAYSLSKLDKPLTSVKELRSLKGIGPVTEKIIIEILQTGSSKYYEKLLNLKDQQTT